VTVFLKLAKGLGNESKITDQDRVLADVRKIFGIQYSIGSGLHDAVVISSPERSAQLNVVPIGGGFGDQEMEHCVIRGGYRST
jgi:hypothetical protein